MSESFLSSDEYDEQAHSLYNEGRYDDALQLLNEGLQIYPHAVELHVGAAYAYLAREDFAWARRGFELALALDPLDRDAGCEEKAAPDGPKDPLRAAICAAARRAPR